MMKLYKRIALLTMLVIPLAAAAVYMFKTLDTRNQMNSSQVNCIMKDSKGYMWFGTPAGLYRYDGYVFRNFQCDSQDGSSLPDSYINNIQEAMDGSLWINTAQGMCLYHPRTETFERDMHQVYTRMGLKGNDPTIVYIDTRKNFWMYVPKRGIVAYNMQKQLMYEFGYTNDVAGIPEGNICSISECREGAVLTYDNGMLVCLSIDNDRRKEWQTNTIAEQQLVHSTSLKTFADASDNIWLYGHGTLMLYMKKTNEWVTAIGSSLGLNGTNADRTVFSMSADKQGNIWMATDRAGLVKLNAGNYAIEYVTPTGLNSKIPAGAIVSTLSTYVDNTGLLWVGTEKNGVAFYGKNIYKFQSALIGDVTAITEDTGGKMWYGTSESGIYGYDGELASRKVSAMAATPDGSVWVGSKQNGLARIKDGATTIYSLANDSSKTLINDHVNALCVDKTGNLWIATNGGLQMYSTKMNTFSSYTKENGRLTTNTVTCLAYGQGNTLYAGTNEGVLVLNISTTEKEMLTGEKKSLNKFTNNYITQVLEDSRGLLWIGTRDGINVYDRSNDRLVYITDKDGLCNNCVRGLTEDGNHNVWITTTNGVCRVVVQRNHEEGTFNYCMYNYDISDGMQGNEFNQGAICTKANGDVILGGVFGINWVNKQGSKVTNESLPKVMLTQLFINDTEIMPGHLYDGNAILPEALNETNSIKLNNSQNTFTIKFAAGNYNQSERLMFMYWMEGKEQDWHNGDALNHGVTFTNLSSGTYRLHVKAISASGAVSNQERVLEIVIERPWWLQWWMIAVYAAIVLGVFYVWRYGLKEVRYVWNKKKMTLAELMRQQQEIKNASDNLMQPMSRMTSIIGNLAETTTTVEGKEQLNSLHFQMLQVITQISEMQMALENPESKASETAESRLQLNTQGYVNALPKEVGEVLTSEFTPPKLVESDKLKKVTMMFIDDSEELQKFIRSYLNDIYDLHIYNSTTDAQKDITILHPNIIVCKDDMPQTTGSDLCNMLKTSTMTANIKFVLMTDGVLSKADMIEQNITISADDYLAKPFNIQEAIMRFNSLLGISDAKLLSDTIEGGETRRLESYNASMTTATLTFTDDDSEAAETPDIRDNTDVSDHSDRSDKSDRSDVSDHSDKSDATDTATAGTTELTLISNVPEMSVQDQLFLYNIEQYVLHNMSNGHISIEAMATAMGMGRVQFFRKVQALVGKTPTELILNMRLKHACTLLEKTDISMSELAINIGLNTADNFITMFKEKYGMSPLIYRTNSRKK